MNPQCELAPLKAMKTMTTLRCMLLALVTVAGSVCARADEPTAQIRDTTDKILALLADPALKTEARNSERRQLIRKELDKRIDWATVARSSLGRHWAKRTRDEQVEFISLFSRHLEETFIDKFETHHSELDKVEYLGEKIIDEYASVKAQVSTKDQLVHPVEYRLQKSGKDWRIYDVLLEGVSLVKNYRDQFDEILAKSSYEKLVADLRAKIPQAVAVAASNLP
jgi:phospholipid transport system substrate-binding protein